MLTLSQKPHFGNMILKLNLAKAPEIVKGYKKQVVFSTNLKSLARQVTVMWGSSWLCLTRHLNLWVFTGLGVKHKILTSLLKDMQQLFVMILAESKAFAETYFTYIKHQLTCPVVHSCFSIARFSGKPKSCYLDFSTVELNFLSLWSSLPGSCFL